MRTLLRQERTMAVMKGSPIGGTLRRSCTRAQAFKP